MALPEASFIWGANGAKLTPEEIAMQRAILARKGGIDTSPVGHWAQGAARVADAIAGAFQRGNLDKQEAANTAYDATLASPLAEALAGGVAAYPSSVAAGGSGTAPAATGVASPTVDLSGDKGAFISAILPAAIEHGARIGVDPRIIVAQAAQETGWGKSAPGNNFFGIKSHGQGGGQNLATHEVINGKRVAVNDSFRTFASPADSVAGYADFLSSNKRYRPMLEAKDLDSQLAALGSSGYATDPNYASSVGAIARSIPLPSAAPVQTASLDPSVGMATAYAPEAATVPPAAAAIEAVAPQFTPEQLANGNDASGMSMIPAPGSIPYTGPGAQTGQPMLVYDDKGMRMEPPVTPVSLPGADQGIGGVAYEQVPPVIAAGAPMVQPPADVSRVPALSGANGLPVVGPTGEPSAAAPISGQARVAAALQAYPVQAQAAAGDQMVAGADQTLQPGAEQGGAFPSAPVGAPTNTAPFAQPDYLDAAGGGQAQTQAQGNPIAAAVRAISDPRASPQTKAVAELVIKQAQQRQAAVAEQQVWQQRQAFEAQQQANDPKRQLEIQKLQREVNAPAERKTITVNGTVLDAQTMQPVYTAPEKRTADLEEYDAYSAQEKAAGRQPLGLLQYQQELKKAGASNTTVSVGGNSGKFLEESDKAAATRLGTIVEQGNAAPQMMSDLQKLTELGAQIGTGKGAQLLQAIGPYAQAAGIDIKGLDEGQAYQAIVDRLAPNMRPAGAGATSDFDARQYLSSLPSMARTPGGNAIVSKTLQSLQENKIKAADIASRAQSGEITWQDAEKQIRSMADPYLAFKKFNIAQEETKNIDKPTDVDDKVWEFMTPEEKRLFNK